MVPGPQMRSQCRGLSFGGLHVVTAMYTLVTRHKMDIAWRWASRQQRAFWDPSWVG